MNDPHEETSKLHQGSEGFSLSRPLEMKLLTGDEQKQVQTLERGGMFWRDAVAVIRADRVPTRFNLAAGEAVWVTRQVDAGVDMLEAVVEARRSRVGPNSEPSHRPISEAVQRELGIFVEFVPRTSDDLLDAHGTAV